MGTCDGIGHNRSLLFQFQDDVRRLNKSEMVWPESRLKEQNQYKICSKYFLIKVNDVLKLSCLKFVMKTKKANFGALL